jgi:hypothetical protein
MTNNRDQEPERLSPEDRRLAHLEYLKKLSNDPRAKQLGTPGQGFTIVGMPRHDQKS